MDFELNEAQRLLKETAADFARRRIMPVARQNDIDGRFPDDIVREMGELGFYGGVIPEEYGGAGMDYISYAVLMEEISKACSSVRTVLSVQMSLVASTILKWGSEAQKHKYLPLLCSAEWIGCLGLTEPDVGSDAQNIKTFATKTDSGWRLDGQKIWI
ncbi:MAG: acyl-CoA dehydrogenase, partial [Nitrospinaceae bacterium]|nr:acyl-CoA dehydrogenase [Nitrospinaceae bacterium]